MKIALLVVGTAAPLLAGTFVPPAEGPAAFRRDRVPLDPDTMMKLSARLTTLADGLEGKDARERRCAAQILALSLALDPVNTSSRKLLRQFPKKRRQSLSDSAELGKQRALLWKYIGWLETPEAGADGQALATCLKDVLAVSDPEDPRLEAWIAGGEKGAWAGWIPGISAYEDDKSEAGTPDPDVPKETPKQEILLAQASVSSPVWKRVEKTYPTQWVMTIAPLNMTARQVPAGESEPQRFSILIGNSDARESSLPPARPIRDLLEKQHGKLPKGGIVRIRSSEINSPLSPGMRQPVSAAVAVLASAALSGREPDAIIIGDVDESGRFTLPGNFWEQLRSVVHSQDSRRLILPAAATADLPSMLALGYPEFFMEHEVLLAGDFQQLLALSAREPDESLAKVTAQFQEIREKSLSQPIGPYVANSFVRRRLEELFQAAPYHCSAKMLAVQGAGQRPAFITRNVLKSELLRAIEPMRWLVKREHSYFERADEVLIGKTIESCRDGVEKLNRYAGTVDHQLIEDVLDLVNLVRALERSMRTRPDLDYDKMDVARTSAYKALVASHAEIVAKLSPEP